MTADPTPDRDDQARDITERGPEILEELGGIPAAFAFAALLLDAGDQGWDDLDGLYTDRWYFGNREWMVILNEPGTIHDIPKLPVQLHGASGLLFCDGAILAEMTPETLRWHMDPDTREGVRDTEYWDVASIESLYHRVRNTGEYDNLPPLSELTTEG